MRGCGANKDRPSAAMEIAAVGSPHTKKGIRWEYLQKVPQQSGPLQCVPESSGNGRRPTGLWENKPTFVALMGHFDRTFLSPRRSFALTRAYFTSEMTLQRPARKAGIAGGAGSGCGRAAKLSSLREVSSLPAPTPK